MGCAGSREDAVFHEQFDGGFPAIKEKPTKNYDKPKWKSDEPLNAEQLKVMRDTFWDTQPHYGGNKVIWDALKAACEADIATAKLIMESAGIIVVTHDMTVCYDERGAKYELPKYVLSDPANLSSSTH